MKIPDRPPLYLDLWTRFAGDGSAAELVDQVRKPTVDGKYLHWDQIRHRKPPGGLTHEAWWFGLKVRRDASAHSLPLTDKTNEPFKYNLSDPLPLYIYQVDKLAAGGIGQNVPAIDPGRKDYFLVRALADEAITSSQLEGARTAAEVAREMLLENRAPRDRSERMIVNDYHAMQRILEVKDDNLTKDLLFEIHSIVTDGTLENPSACGRFRRPEERIVVADPYGETLHFPPPAAELDARVDALLDFSNNNDSASFTHPFLKSMILHFWLAYDHPFVDGNGRTARAIFYWSMLRHGYSLVEYISISKIILRAPARYGMAFLYSETDENDLTYFLHYHADVVLKAIEDFRSFTDRRAHEIAAVSAEMTSNLRLNHRQRDLIRHALKYPDQVYSVAYHQHANKIVYETARRDLLELASLGFLKKRKVSKAWSFTVPADLRQVLRRSR